MRTLAKWLADRISARTLRRTSIQLAIGWALTVAAVVGVVLLAVAGAVAWTALGWLAGTLAPWMPWWGWLAGSVGAVAAALVAVRFDGALQDELRERARNEAAARWVARAFTGAATCDHLGTGWYRDGLDAVRCEACGARLPELGGGD